jgi:hypothetical protein
MIPTSFDAIKQEDIDALVTNAAAEGRRLEYKEKLPDNTDAGTKEFLADASSFANADGGDLLFGIPEKIIDGKTTGTPASAEGLSGINKDAEILRLEQILRTGIDPRVPGIKIKAIDGFIVGPIIILRIPKSWAYPHIVTYKNRSRFYSRTSAGKYQLDVREIRDAFDISSNLKSRIEAFRTDRLTRIEAGQTPAPLLTGPSCILHFYPLNSAMRPGIDDLAVRAFSYSTIQPFYSPLATQRFNLDGFIAFPLIGATTPAYVQVFRYGPIESVFVCKMEELSGGNMEPDRQRAKRGKIIDALMLEGMVRHGLHHFLQVYKKSDMAPPVVFMMSLVRVKDMEIGVNSKWRDYDETSPFDRDIVTFPETIIDSFDVPVDDVLKPIFTICVAGCRSQDQPKLRHCGKVESETGE